MKLSNSTAADHIREARLWLEAGEADNEPREGKVAAAAMALAHATTALAIQGQPSIAVKFDVSGVSTPPSSVSP